MQNEIKTYFESQNTWISTSCIIFMIYNSKKEKLKVKIPNNW